MSHFGSISEAAYLGIYSVILLVQSKKTLNATDIAQKLHASKHHVTKVMLLLQQQGYLGSTRGPQGGYTLLKKPAEINLLEIYELISGRVEISGCSLNRDVCPFPQCVFDHKINQMKLDFRNYLQSKTFDEYTLSEDYS